MSKKNFLNEIMSVGVKLSKISLLKKITKNFLSRLT